MEPQKHLFEKGKSSSKPSFLGSMLIFRGVVKLDHETPSKVEHKKCFELPPPRKKKNGHESYTLVGQGSPTAFFLDEFPPPLDPVTAGT